MAPGRFFGTLWAHVLAWARKLVPEAWLESALVPLFKNKGDVADLDNWRGVVLLDVVSKMVSQLLNSRLRMTAHDGASVVV